MPTTIHSVEEQNMMIEKTLWEKADLIILSPCAYKRQKKIIKKITDANVPLILIDTLWLSKISYANTYSIVFDNYVWWVKMWEYFLANIKKGSSLAIFHGSKEENHYLRVVWFLDTVKQSYVIIDQKDLSFDENKAYTETVRLITSKKNVEYIRCTSDNMAYGAINAIQAYHAPIKVAWFDGTHTWITLIRQNKLEATIGVFTEKFWTYWLKMAYDILVKKILPSNICYTPQLITKKNNTSHAKSITQKRNYQIVAPENILAYPISSVEDSLLCPIFIWLDMGKDIPLLLKKCSNISDVFIITDTIVQQLYGDKLLYSLKQNWWVVQIFVLPNGEKAKSFFTLEKLAYDILDKKINKKSFGIILWWWVVWNIWWFISALLFRWVRYIHIPTTIIHQADASTWWKQAINTYHGKNTIGTFYEPEFIYNDTSTIKTLPEREYYNGFAEIIKHGLCQSNELIELLWDKHTPYEEILVKTIQLKIDVMTKDPREKNEWYILIYGHTIGHILEKLSGGELLHGEAISIGMVIASEISYKMWYTKKSLLQQHKDILQQYHLPVSIPKTMKKSAIMQMLDYDKKERNNLVTFCLLTAIWKPVITHDSYACEVPYTIIEEALLNNFEK